MGMQNRTPNPFSLLPCVIATHRMARTFRNRVEAMGIKEVVAHNDHLGRTRT